MIEPLQPKEMPQGHPRRTLLSEVLNALLYMTHTGCLLRLSLKVPPSSTKVQGRFYEWRRLRLCHKIIHEHLMRLRAAAWREAWPIDTQPVQTMERKSPCGDKAGKEIKGHKRFIPTFTSDFLVIASAFSWTMTSSVHLLMRRQANA
ncbi:MAG: transposase [Alphaproteobacteria bacterium]|nr:transposase [Alphaproteobacteria bacterium]